MDALAAEAHALDNEDVEDEQQQDVHDTNELETSEHSAMRHCSFRAVVGREMDMLTICHGIIFHYAYLLFLTAYGGQIVSIPLLVSHEEDME